MLEFLYIERGLTPNMAFSRGCKPRINLAKEYSRLSPLHVA